MDLSRKTSYLHNITKDMCFLKLVFLSSSLFPSVYACFQILTCHSQLLNMHALHIFKENSYKIYFSVFLAMIFSVRYNLEKYFETWNFFMLERENVWSFAPIYILRQIRFRKKPFECSKFRCFYSAKMKAADSSGCHRMAVRFLSSVVVWWVQSAGRVIYRWLDHQLDTSMLSGTLCLEGNCVKRYVQNCLENGQAQWENEPQRPRYFAAAIAMHQAGGLHISGGCIMGGSGTSLGVACQWGFYIIAVAY